MKGRKVQIALLNHFASLSNNPQTGGKMFIPFLNRTSRRNQIISNLSTVRHHFLSTSTTAGTSDLYLKYSFKPPPSLNRNPNPNPNSKPQPQNKPKKAPFRPPSSLDRSGKNPVRSTLPFDFQYSYTESSPDVRPIGLREPKYSPFGPDRVDRIWTGVCAPAVDPKLGKEAAEKVEKKRRKMREDVQGEELTEAEKKVIVDSCHRKKTKKQINLGRDGLTHNMLNDIHNTWKHAEAVRIKCMGVPTVDMKNICAQLEDKAFGKIIHRHGSLLLLYRGRNYDPKKRPVIPVMLWKPKEPIYPKLIKTTIEGLSIEETKEMRKKGLAVPALTKLAKNGYYACLVPMVRDAFLVIELVRIDCRGLEAKDYKKIGCKLRDLVPCILVTFDKEQIVIWKGKNYKPKDSGYMFSDEEMFDTPSNNMTTDSKRQIPNNFRTHVDFDSGQEE